MKGTANRPTANSKGKAPKVPKNTTTRGSATAYAPFAKSNPMPGQSKGMKKGKKK